MSSDNKSIVQQALSELLGPGGVDALAPLIRDDFLHHRPDATSSTKTEWLAAVGAALVPLADMRIEIRHVLADDDHVVMHTRRWLPESGAEVAVIDILRLDDGLIAEAWEIIEPTSHATANLSWWTERPAPAPA
ncbi:nuclear transport factor 2 family protein [Actinomadura syzygii]|uniref:Ester cyclase n=1 Tax=Actinomadura syzygii TaxID=1427538 RepID=A0A5D0ULL4_9ACTN|nr:nuclear transport factor 2 family protein [Actinomadura syzygii]TYC18720.1 ester cyclase [Actinomadura syzygii]